MKSWRARDFWGEALAWHGSATPHVLPRVALFGAIAALVVAASRTPLDPRMPVGPHEVAGAVLSLMLVLRTNASYERWWEARKLWGGIVNQTRNLAIQALAYGPRDARWRREVVRWTVAFAHVARRSLRGERELPEVAALVGEAQAALIARSSHMPSATARRIGELLRAALESEAMSGFAFHRAERERATLIDHIGACERILRTPLARVYSVKIRRFIVLFLVTLPFALLNKLEADWLVPLVTMLVAYPVLAVDTIGAEIQNPFLTQNVGHLPLDDICRTIEGNLLGLVEDEWSLAEEGGESPVEIARDGAPLRHSPADAD